MRDHQYYRRGLGWLLRFILRPRLANPLRMLPLKRLAELRGMTRPLDGPPPVVIDNRALDGFMERFRSTSCIGVDCENCRWCHEFAARAVKIDDSNRAEALAAYEELFASLNGGGMWCYLPKRKKTETLPASAPQHAGLTAAAAVLSCPRTQDFLNLSASAAKGEWAREGRSWRLVGPS